MAAAGSGRAWYHKHLGRMETEKLLVESREDGSFLIRESDTVRGAYVLSTIYQQRIHHYRILPTEEGKLSIQAQQGVQRKQFSHLDDMVEYYSHSRRGLVCALTIPISPKKEEEEEEEEVLDDGDDSDVDDDTDNGVEESREKNLVSKFLLAFLSTMDTSRVEESFLEQVRSYLNKDVSVDIESMTTPTPQLSSFKQLFYKDCLVLHKQLNKIMAQVDLMKSLFERAGGAKHGAGGGIVSPSKHLKSSVNDTDYDTITYKLHDCAEAITSVETIAFQMLRELCSSMTGGKAASNTLLQPAANGVVAKRHTLPRNGGDEDEVVFDVKLEQGIPLSGLTSRKNITILVNLKECMFQFYKPGDSQRSTYTHNQLLQLVKSRSRDTRLSVVFQGQSRKEYIFNDMQSREQFCQLTQLIRNRKRAGEDQDSISVFVGSWNMGDAGPPPDITSWIQSLGLGKTLPGALLQAHDIYAFGTQETSIAEKEWTAKIRQTLKSIHDVDYEKVVCQSLWGMRCLIMAKPEHMNKIAHVQTSSVKTGIGNTLGNKGGVGISFFFGSVSLGFICTHLTSGNEKCSRRNQNYHDILKGMSNLKQKKLCQFDLTSQFNHLFFFGDLNYRVDLGATEIVEFAKNYDHFSIYSEDQLKKEKEKKAVFVGFEESPILFPPTYRFQRGSRTLDDYVWVKQKRSGIRINVPSYCDRVLWRSYPGAGIINTSYGCTDDITTSDHSPVFATFQMHGFMQYAYDSGKDVVKNENALILVDQCNARIATSSKTNFYMEFYSSCFEGTHKTPSNNEWQTMAEPNCCCPVWKTGVSVANIKPIITEEGYLEQQHLLVMLKGQEGDEPYAECCISLRGVIGSEPVKVIRELTHLGHYVGELEIMIHVTLDTYRERKTEEELYTEVDFITQDDHQSAQESGLLSSLDKPGVNRKRSGASTSDCDLGNGKTGNPRPKLPIPYGSTSSSSSNINNISNSSNMDSRHRATLPGMTSPSQSNPPPPLPRRRDLNSAAPLPIPTSQRPPIATPTSRPMDVPPPAVPFRRGAESLGRGQYSRSDPPRSDSPRADPTDNRLESRLRGTVSPNPNAPIPVKRKAVRQATNPTPGDQNPPFPPPTAPRHTPPSTAPPTSPRSRQMPEIFPGGGPPVPRRQGGGGRSPRPPSTVKSLLETHGLQQFSDVLLTNGYDDLHFLAEVSEAELQEIGIKQLTDREKLLKVFNYYAHNH